MRISTIVALAALGCLVAPGSEARAAAFCAYYFDGATNCGFYTFQQCLADVHGVGGSCYQNPGYGYGAAPYDGGVMQQPHRRHYRRDY
jgi:Protein of unknown function (DUF3551)